MHARGRTITHAQGRTITHAQGKVAPRLRGRTTTHAQGRTTTHARGKVATRVRGRRTQQAQAIQRKHGSTGVLVACTCAPLSCTTPRTKHAHTVHTERPHLQRHEQPALVVVHTSSPPVPAAQLRLKRWRVPFFQRVHRLRCGCGTTKGCGGSLEARPFPDCGMVVDDGGGVGQVARRGWWRICIGQGQGIGTNDRRLADGCRSSTLCEALGV
eukprot:349634-Chlamydomonas_euryale.AAC.20